MEITLQINDSVYESLVAGGGRVRGSIGLVSPREGNFNEYSRQPAEQAGGRYIRLRHGKACVNRNRVTLRLSIGLNEEQICPSETIEQESREASTFVDSTLDDFRDTFGW